MDVLSILASFPHQSSGQGDSAANPLLASFQSKGSHQAYIDGAFLSSL